jgi:CheY-like chemotaxis protein
MSKCKVLIVDDEKLLVKSTCMALGYFDYEATGALDGKEGLQKAESLRPDIILLDIMMPAMDGWEVLKKLKGNEATKNIPVIMFTAKEYSNGKKLAQSSGAVDFIAKPFELEELAELIKKHTL